MRVSRSSHLVQLCHVTELGSTVCASAEVTFRGYFSISGRLAGFVGSSSMLWQVSDTVAFCDPSDPLKILSKIIGKTQKLLGWQMGSPIGVRCSRRPGFRKNRRAARSPVWRSCWRRRQLCSEVSNQTWVSVGSVMVKGVRA